ncbi:serrate RNA effector molecule homolog [Mercenaria mercenaria]|uniref:serrate RNA effector molecule homolog n=1 Tax=Mercenaria mercenaria TaxID=6596 RepID=UPI00234E52EA|nr:serrate RNA effector molecule homolog [Mercenaria mercenaria]
MERNTFAHVRGRAYRCRHCFSKGKTEINTKQRMEDHVYKYHVPNDEQPFWCRLCLFRCRSKELLSKHVTTYTRHRNVMSEKGITESRQFLVCNPDPHLIGSKDIELLSKADSMNWWLFKQDKLSPKVDIVQEAVREAGIGMASCGKESEDPLDLTRGSFDSMQTESEQAAEDLRVIVERDTYVEKVEGVEEAEMETIETYVATPMLDEPLDLRVVKEKVVSGVEVKDTEDELQIEVGESLKEIVVEGEKDEGQQQVPEAKEEESVGEEHLDNRGQEEVQVRKAGKRRAQKESDRRDRARKRVRHTLKKYKSPSPSSSSSSSSSSSESDTDSDYDSREREQREKRFTDILGEMVRKTGEIIGEQVIANAALINKLQSTVDELRKEVRELREEKQACDMSKEKKKGEGEGNRDGKREERKIESTQKKDKGHDQSKDKDMRRDKIGGCKIRKIELCRGNQDYRTLGPDLSGGMTMVNSGIGGEIDIDLELLNI